MILDAQFSLDMLSNWKACTDSEIVNRQVLVKITQGIIERQMKTSVAAQKYS